MLTTLQVTTEPLAEPVTVARARAHCRIDNVGEDDLLAGFLMTARIMAEGYLSRALLTQTALWSMRPVPDLRFRHVEENRLRGELILPRAPVQSIESVTVTDRYGDVTVIDEAVLPFSPALPLIGYVKDIGLEPGRLRIGGMTPMAGGYIMRNVRVAKIAISMVLGYGLAENVPEPIKQAILLTTAFLYENRGDAGGEMPRAAEWLLDRYRLQWLGG